MGKIRLLIIEKHTAVRTALEMRLRSSSRIGVTTAACDVIEGKLRSREQQPDVVLIGLTGSRDHERSPIVKMIADLTRRGMAVIVLASYANDVERELVLEAGAHRYLLKDINSSQLITEIETVADKIGT